MTVRDLQRILASLCLDDGTIKDREVFVNDGDDDLEFIVTVRTDGLVRFDTTADVTGPKLIVED